MTPLTEFLGEVRGLNQHVTVNYAFDPMDCGDTKTMYPISVLTINAARLPAIVKAVRESVRCHDRYKDLFDDKNLLRLIHQFCVFDPDSEEHTLETALEIGDPHMTRWWFEKRSQTEELSKLIHEIIPDKSAASDNRVSMFKYLVDSGRMEDRDAWTFHHAVYVAADRGQLRMVEILLDAYNLHGYIDTLFVISAANIAASHLAASHLAASHGPEYGEIYDEIVKLILTRYCGEKIEPHKILTPAAKGCREPLVQYLITHHRNELTQDHINTAIQAAVCEEGSCGVIRQLVNCGGDIEPVGAEALVEAVQLEDKVMIDFILKKGVDIQVQDNAAIFTAIGSGSIDMVDHLVSLGASIHGEHNLGEAAAEGNIGMLEHLLQMGADIHAFDDEALRAAARCNELPTLRFLLRRGANVQAQDNEALIVASEYGWLSIVRELLRHGADVSAQNNEALHRARALAQNKSQRTPLIRLLLAAAAAATVRRRRRREQC